MYEYWLHFVYPTLKYLVLNDELFFFFLYFVALKSYVNVNETVKNGGEFCHVLFLLITQDLWS